ncbi:acid phosphatase [Luteimonas sp. SJ-92]|uniref:Acid phosphatase n=1 Tax=Luteimonas salinisoli TaxID=2752307 RepID=A0A853JDY2_9GAMM|nr:HAD family acid phosphatase [Luteimonas salinisoli]NZA26797.1 acid phosphatase [Luteimonas salinisoli]
MRKNLLAACLLALALGACQSLPTAPSTTPAAAAADDNLNAVLWIQSSAEYRAVALSVFQAAGARLDQALADPEWDALDPEERALAGSAAGLPPAVIVDIDETVLDNSPYQARLIRDGAEYHDDDWEAWVAERSAAPVPGALAFARLADSRGVTVVYLSNRTRASAADTLANLREAGFPVANEDAFLGKGTVVEGCAGTGSDKHCRRLLAGSRYRVLMQFGDQLGDFVADRDTARQARDRLLVRHADWFGERWWMLPNPTYGGWEAATFDGDWSQPRERRRAAKHAALRTGPE